MSSCTIRNASTAISIPNGASALLTSNNIYAANSTFGFYFLFTVGSTVTFNNVYGTYTTGIDLSAAFNTIVTSNNSYGNAGDGIFFQGGSSTNQTLTSNNIYSNTAYGIHLADSNNTLTSNNIYSNGSYGIYVTASTNTLTSNNIFANASDGIYVASSSNTITSNNHIYSNGGYGLYLYQSSSVISTNDYYGYNAGLSSLPDTTAEIWIDSTTTASNLTLYGAQVNPSVGISTAGFSQTGTAPISYNQNFATGTVRIYGDYQDFGVHLHPWLCHRQLYRRL